jgi:hypothetical protein
MGNTLCNTYAQDTLDLNPRLSQNRVNNERGEKSLSSLGKTTGSSMTNFSLFNRLGKQDK